MRFRFNANPYDIHGYRINGSQSFTVHISYWRLLGMFARKVNFSKAAIISPHVRINNWLQEWSGVRAVASAYRHFYICCNHCVCEWEREKIVAQWLFNKLPENLALWHQRQMSIAKNIPELIQIFISETVHTNARDRLAFIRFILASCLFNTFVCVFFFSCSIHASLFFGVGSMFY